MDVQFLYSSLSRYGQVGDERRQLGTLLNELIRSSPSNGIISRQALARRRPIRRQLVPDGVDVSDKAVRVSEFPQSEEGKAVRTQPREAS